VLFDYPSPPSHIHEERYSRTLTVCVFLHFLRHASVHLQFGTQICDPRRWRNFWKDWWKKTVLLLPRGRAGKVWCKVDCNR